MISDRIRTLRENAGISQAELARRLDTSRSSVNAWEMGISSPTAVFIVEMAKLFHVSSDFILGLESDVKINLTGLSEDEVHILYELLNYFDKK